MTLEQSAGAEGHRQLSDRIRGVLALPVVSNSNEELQPRELR